MATLPADHGHNERRLEGIRQCNLQIEAAKNGAPVPEIDTSYLSPNSFYPDLSQPNQPMTPMERYLTGDLHQEPSVIYTRTATLREVEGMSQIENSDERIWANCVW